VLDIHRQTVHHILKNTAVQNVNKPFVYITDLTSTLNILPSIIINTIPVHHFCLKTVRLEHTCYFDCVQMLLVLDQSVLRLDPFQLVSGLCRLKNLLVFSVNMEDLAN
jgi:hypothetical protein